MVYIQLSRPGILQEFDSVMKFHFQMPPFPVAVKESSCKL